MTDNINKLSQNINGNKHQQTSASIVNLTDEGKQRLFLIFNLNNLYYIEKRTDKTIIFE
jgi:hypothetical protein